MTTSSSDDFQVVRAPEVRDDHIAVWRLCLDHDPQPQLGQFNWPWALGLALDALDAARSDNERLGQWIDSEKVRQESIISRYMSEVERLRALVDSQLGECIGCNYDDGPDEYCPHHGRSYTDALDVAQRIITQARAEVEASVQGGENYRENFRSEVADLRAALEEADLRAGAHALTAERRQAALDRVLALCDQAEMISRLAPVARVNHPDSVMASIRTVRAAAAVPTTKDGATG